MAEEYRPHIVLMDINMPDVDGITATQEMSIRAPYSQVIIMTVQAEQHYMKQAMAAGARDFQPKPFTSEELVNCVRRVYNYSLPIYQQLEAAHQVQAQKAAQTEAQRVEDRAGTQVIAVYSPKGGIGTSTIAANLAVALQQRYGDVVLMDADLQFGDILVHLNTRPTRTMSDLVHEGGFDLELVTDVLLPHNSGLKLLLAPPQPELADAVSVEMVAGLIKSLRGDFRAVVVDTPHKLDDKTVAVLENADYILLILTPELPAIKSGKLFLELYDRLEYDRTRLGVVINKADLASGISPAKIEKILKVEHTFRIPHDPRLILAVNRGIIVVQQEPNSPSAQAIIQLAEQIGQELAEPKDALPVPE
jgi:pilus assembly protein CpaE